MNDAPAPPLPLGEKKDLKKINQQKQYDEKQQEAHRPAVVDVVRATVARNPSMLNTVTFDPLHSALSVCWTKEKKN